MLAQRSRRFVVSLFVCLLLGGILGADEKKKAPVRLALLDLRSPQRIAWLGPAVREALAAKLAGLDALQILEREEVESLLASHTGLESPPAPSMLGAQYVLTGSVQVLGEWGQPDARVRINASIASTETAQVHGDGAFVLDGTIGGIFELETELATRLVRAVGEEPQLRILQRRESRSLRSREHFGRGLRALRAARAALGRTEEGAPFSAEGRERARPLLETAASSFRAAQETNRGAFFATEHRYESDARELLARCQPDREATRRVRSETVERFRRDAAEAAPAFYNLGRALQASGSYRDALQAYDQYLQWMAENARVVRWRRENVYATRVRTPVVFGSNLALRGSVEYMAGTPSYLILGGAPGVKVFRRGTNELLWKGGMKGPRSPFASSERFMNGTDEILAVVNGTWLRIYRTPDGEVLFDEEVLQTSLGSNPHRTLLYLHETSAGDPLVTLFRATAGGAEFCTVDAERGDVLWRKALPPGTTPEKAKDVPFALPVLWEGAFITRILQNDRFDLDLRDATSGEDAADRFSPEVQAVLRRSAGGAPLQLLRGRGNTGLYALGTQKEGRQTALEIQHLRGAEGPISGVDAGAHALEYWSGATRGAGIDDLVRQRETYRQGDPALILDQKSETVDLRGYRWPQRPKNMLPRTKVGRIFGNTLFYRKRQTVQMYRLQEAGDPQLLYTYTCPWRMYSTPLYGTDSFYLFITETGMGGCDLIQVGLPTETRPVASEVQTLAQIATCHESAGRPEAAVESLEKALTAQANQPEVRLRLIRLLERLGRGGECSYHCEQAAKGRRRTDPARQELFRIYRRVLGVPDAWTPQWSRSNDSRPSPYLREDLRGQTYLALFHGHPCSWDLRKGTRNWSRHDRFAPTRQGKRRLICGQSVPAQIKGESVFLLDSRKSGPGATIRRVHLRTGDILSTHEEAAGEWHPLWRLPKRTLAAGRDYTYDAFLQRSPFRSDSTPVVYAGLQREGTDVIALDAASGGLLWRKRLGPVYEIGHVACAFLVDRLVLGRIHPDDRTRVDLLTCRYESGQPLWQRTIQWLPPRRKRQALVLLRYGGVLEVIEYFSHEGLKTNFRNRRRVFVNARNGETLARNDASPMDWIFHPDGLDALEDMDRVRIPPDEARQVKSPPPGYIAGEIFPGGPLLISSGRSNAVFLADPQTGEILVRSMIGLEGPLGTCNRPRVCGDYILASSRVFQRCESGILFRKEVFLRAIGWTDGMDRAYRTRYGPGEGAEEPAEDRSR